MAPVTALNGLTVRQVLAGANVVLGGGTGLYDASTYDAVALGISEAFEGGRATGFAQDHLVIGACP